jgi:hypothetical protein
MKGLGLSKYWPMQPTIRSGHKGTRCSRCVNGRSGVTASTNWVHDRLETGMPILLDTGLSIWKHKGNNWRLISILIGEKHFDILCCCIS